MNIAITIPPSDFATRLQAARIALAAGEDAGLEEMARRHGLALRDVLALLPSSQARRANGRRFAEIWDELASWGRVVFVTSDAHGAFEMTTQLRAGRAGRSLFDLFGATPPTGDTSWDRCSEIWFVDRPAAGRRSCSLVFLDRAGGALFSIHVRRDMMQELDSVQVMKFEAMKTRWRGNAWL
jgi:putative heme utilization carrier protein HutX